MSSATKKKSPAKSVLPPKLKPVVGKPLLIHEITELLIKHYDIHEGLYSLRIEFNIGVGNVGPSDKRDPGVIVGLHSFALTPAEKSEGTATVDAAAVNPAPSKIK
jgi:hypothetical protein